MIESSQVILIIARGNRGRKHLNHFDVEIRLQINIHMTGYWLGRIIRSSISDQKIIDSNCNRVWNNGMQPTMNFDYNMNVSTKHGDLTLQMTIRTG